MELSFLFYISLSTLLVGLGAGFFFLFHWFLNRTHKFALWLGVGFSVLYLFQIPKILTNSDIGFSLDQFGVFLPIFLFLNFLGWILIFFGLIRVLPHKHYKTAARAVWVWAGLNLVFHLATFFVGGTGGIYAWVPLYVLLFLVPINLLILVSLWRWHHHAGWLSDFKSRLGVTFIMSGAVLNIVRLLMIVYTVSASAGELNFFTLSGNDLFFIMQAITTLLIAAGFVLLHKTCCQLVDGNAPAEQKIEDRM